MQGRALIARRLLARMVSIGACVTLLCAWTTHRPLTHARKRDPSHKTARHATHASVEKHAAVQTGRASYYADTFQGRLTASGERYDMYALTAAHRTLPLGACVRVSNASKTKSVVVRINDRGPFEKGRVIDLSFAAAVLLGLQHAGTGQVSIERVSAHEAKAASAIMSESGGTSVPETCKSKSKSKSKSGRADTMRSRAHDAFPFHP